MKRNKRWSPNRDSKAPENGNNQQEGGRCLDRDVTMNYDVTIRTATSEKALSLRHYSNQSADINTFASPNNFMRVHCLNFRLTGKKPETPRAYVTCPKSQLLVVALRFETGHLRQTHTLRNKDGEESPRARDPGQGAEAH